MATMNERLAEDAELRGVLAAAIRDYEKARDALGGTGLKGHPGGGPGRIKCLHAHTAQHLLTAANPVGKAVLEELNWTDPAKPCI